ncbi:MAG TPA: NrfD/PsrC family molybdoenzyme membrane anchor subunit [Candidatus Limnocylindria bacterium]|nr:NrfD/PsrC family molybdoenzyme membrane anchor subunit [Candidatus Limnocylindria bacterium]
MINPYVLEPHWANWMLTLEMFVAGVAAGTFFLIALMNAASAPGRAGAEDREVAARLGFIPMPLMLVVAILLIADLGEPGRFMNIIFRSPIAEERGPGIFMFNPNSPMTWGTYVIALFGLLTLVPFADALLHTGRLGREPVAADRRRILETVAHHPIGMAFCALVALAVGTYSGVLLNVTSQNVWGDTILLGAMYMVFSALSGAAVAAIVADRLGYARTASAVRSLLVWFAAISGLLLLVFLVNLAAVGRASPLVADLDQLVAPIFWIGVVGLAILYPLLALWRRGPVVTRGGRSLAVAGLDLGRLAVVGTGVLIGVLAFRYVLLYSALAATQ